MRSSRAVVVAGFLIGAFALAAALALSAQRQPGTNGASPSPGGTPAASVASRPPAGSPSPSVGVAGSASPPRTASPSPSAGAAGTGGIPAVRIQIERLGIDLPVVEGDGVTAPDREAAHFPGSAWPDAGSNTYIYGHAREGVFLRLWDAKLGDIVVLTLADGSSRCFAIDELRPRTPWNDLSVLLPTDEERLTLQTSTSYTPTAPRFVVIARPCD